MAIKNFVEQNLARGELITIVSLDVEGAFYAAWWPGILKELRECKCSKYIYELANSYFSKRTAVMAMNTLGIEKGIRRGCPQGSRSVPAMWNLQYNSLLKLKLMDRTKVWPSQMI